MTLLNGDVEQQIFAEYEKRRIQLEESDEDKRLEDAVALVHRKDELLREALMSDDSQIRRFKEVCDLWCAVWFWPIDAKVPPPTTLTYHDLVGIILQLPGLRVTANADDYLKIARKLAQEEMRFFHWELEFPEVWFDNEGNPLEHGGFDVVVGNPPWDSILLNSKEFWSNYLPTFRALGKQEALHVTRDLRAAPEIDFHWRKYLKEINQQYNIFKSGNFFTWQGSGVFNTYKLFLEQMIRITKASRIFSIVVPSGIYTDEGSTPLRQNLFIRNKNRFTLSVENRGGIFPIDSRFKVVLLSGQKTHQEQFLEANNAHVVKGLFLVGKDTSGRDLAPSKPELGLLFSQLERYLLQIPIRTIKKLAPDTLSLMEFKSQREIDLIDKIYADHPLLGSKIEHAWNATTQREFHMTDNSNLFEERPGGWPLWEGKMIYQFNSDYSKPRYWVKEHAGITELARKAELEDYQVPTGWHACEPKLGCNNFRLVYRKVARNTDEVTLIVALLPPDNFIGNSIDEFVQWKFLPKPHPIWVKNFDEANKLFLASVLNSLVLNFIIRQKVSANISMYLLGQLPVPRLPSDHPISQLLVPLAAKLTCVDERFAPLWKELAVYHSDTIQPEWDESCAVTDPSKRAQLRAQTDAIIADLYNLSEHDFAYILNTFPLLDRDQLPLPDEGRSFITRDLALLALFQHRGKTPPADIVSFFAEAGVGIRQRTGSITDLAERVYVAIQEQGAIAYQPTQREKEENDGGEEILEQEELDFYDEE